MSKKIKNTSGKKITSYILIGGLAFATEFTVFLTLYETLPNLLLAQSLSFLAGLLVSFLGNRHITFVSRTETYTLGATRQLVGYVVLALINLALTNIVIYLLIEGVQVPAVAAKVLVMMMVVAWNYLIFNKIIFSTK